LSWAIGVVAFFVAGITAAHACDTWVAMRDATAEHSVLLCKNSDRPPMEAQPLVQFPHQMHAPGERVKCTYIEIPQVAETYENIGSKIWWAFGYEQGINEYGVASRPSPHWQRFFRKHRLVADWVWTSCGWAWNAAKRPTRPCTL